MPHNTNNDGPELDVSHTVCEGCGQAHPSHDHDHDPVAINAMSALAGWVGFMSTPIDPEQADGKTGVAIPINHPVFAFLYSLANVSLPGELTYPDPETVPKTVPESAPGAPYPLPERTPAEMATLIEEVITTTRGLFVQGRGYVVMVTAPVSEHGAN